MRGDTGGRNGRQTDLLPGMGVLCFSAVRVRSASTT